MLPIEWPERLYQPLHTQFGSLRRVECLHGLSQNNIWLAVFDRQSVVVKASKHSAETSFYLNFSEQLKQYGVFAPQLFYSLAEDNRYWLALEHVPTPLPRERWLADRDVIAMLCKLHRSAVSFGATCFRPKWDNMMTENTLSYFEADVEEKIRPILTHRQAIAQHLFAQTAPISGDPNPANWGIRGDGTLVLFDWERFCLGAPAIDLAITVPGLGKAEDFEQVARLYLGAAASAEVIMQLLTEMIAAKTWTIVELLSNTLTADVSYQHILTQLVADFQDWLMQSMEK